MQHNRVGDLAVECAPGLWFPQMVQTRGPAPGVEPAGRYRVSALLVCDFLELRYDVFQVQLSGHDAEGRFTHPIDTVTYRSLRLLELREGIGDQAAWSTEELPDYAETFELRPKPVKDKDEYTKLVSVARQYVRGSLSGRKPQRDVSDELNMPIATAGRWIRRARDLGYLQDGTTLPEEVSSHGEAQQD